MLVIKNLFSKNQIRTEKCSIKKTEVCLCVQVINFNCIILRLFAIIKKKQFCSVFVEYILHALGDLYVFPLHVVVPVTMLFPSCTWPVAASDFHYTEPKTYLYE